MTKEELENYVPKGNIEGFPKGIISLMLDYQEEQGNPRDVSVFERRAVARQPDKGFEWDYTQEGWDFWHKVINNKNFNFFFEKYPKIDFNNLPKRQEPKRWRAENGRLYYFINFYIKDWFFSDETEDVNNPIDNINYNSGNYFSTEVEAEIIAQKLNTYMRQLIEEEHEHKRI